MSHRSTLGLSFVLLLCVLVSPFTISSRAERAATSDPPVAETGSWWHGGPRGGKAHALAVSPAFATDGIAFSGEWLTSLQSTESGMGIIKSGDGGQRWYPSAQGTEGVAYSSAVHAYAFSPAFGDDDTVFAATWGGLFKSRDQGRSWQWLSEAYAGPPGAYTTIAVAPDFGTSELVLAGDWNRLLRSDDGGEHWSSHDQVSSSGAIAFSPDFASDETIFAGGANLYRTIDGGSNWQQVLTGTVTSLALSPAFPHDRIAFAAGGRTLYRSGNGGTSWISSTITAEAPIIYALATAPDFDGSAAGADTLFAGTTAGLFRSDDGSQSWQPVAAYAGVPVHSLAISPQWPTHRVLLVGTAAGVDRYLGPGTPRASTRGFLPLASYALAWSPAANLLLAGTANHGVYGTLDRGNRWQPWGQQEGHTYYTYNNVAISPAYESDHTLFSSSKSGIGIGGSLYRSTDQGASWHFVYSRDYIGDVEFSPAFATDHTVFASSGERHVVRSTAAGEKDSWQEVGTWPADIQGGAAQEIEVPPTYPADSTLFAGGSDGFWRLRPGETAWEQAASGLSRNHYLRDLEISPAFAQDQTLLALASWDNYNRHGVFRSTDGGANWQQVGSGVPNVELRDVAFSPTFAVDDTLYLTTGEGDLYRSPDGGDSWLLLTRVPAGGVSDLLALSQSQVAVAAESGVWHYVTGPYGLVSNGGFEADSGWAMPFTPYPARYSTAVVFAGRRALQTGIVAAPNIQADSSAYQTLTIPAGMETVLRFHYYPISEESTRVAPAQQPLAGREGAIAGDLQYATLFSADGQTALEPLLSQVSDARQWQSMSADLSAYAGQTVRLYFGSVNDGEGGRTALYVDEVSLSIAYPPAAYLPLIKR